MAAVEITENEIVSAQLFEEWFMQTFDLQHENDPHMDWIGLVLLFAKAEVFTAPQSLLLEPNSHLGLLVLCGQLMQKKMPRGPWNASTLSPPQNRISVYSLAQHVCCRWSLQRHTLHTHQDKWPHTRM
jgi:hypothetical protein